MEDETVDVGACRRIVVQLTAAVGQLTIGFFNALWKGTNRSWGALRKMYYCRDGVLI